LSLPSEIIVIKFGGSVLEDEKSMARAAALVNNAQRKGFGVVVVVSAMKGVTDRLLSMSKKLNPNASPRMLDDVLSVGERTSARLFATALAAYDIEAEVIDPDSRYWPIVTDSRHQDASPIVEETKRKSAELVLPLLREGKVPVICGFVGRAANGDVTTLGRGGSDTTAVLLGSSLGAKEVILIKDVEGVFSSDPDRVSDPRLVEELWGEEASLLASGGAKFLHSKALKYKSDNLKIRVTSIERVDSGTVIHGELPDLQLEVHPEEVTMLTIVGVTSPRDCLTVVHEMIEASKATLLTMSFEATSILLYVAGGNNPLETIHNAMVGRGLGKAVSSYEGLTMIAVKGSGLETQPGLIQRVTQPLARAGVNVYGMVTISSSIRVFVSSEKAIEAAEMIKSALLVDK
jgi:aspartate kinase